MSTDLVLVEPPATQLPAPGLDLVTAFLAGRRPTTLRSYDADLRDFSKAIGASSSRQAVQMLLGEGQGAANARVLAYRASLVERHLSAATIARRLASLRSVVKLGRTLGMVSWELEVASPRVEPFRDTRGPGDAGWRAVLDRAKAEAGSRDPIALRNLALLRLLHDLGLRRGEVVSLDLADVDLTGSTLSILGKGRNDRETLTLPAPVRAALADWIGVRGEDPGPLFIRLDRAADGPGRLTANGLYRIVQAIGEDAGLSRPLAPHQLRHAAITQVLDRNAGDLRAAAKFSRHRNLQTLVRYDDSRRDLAGEMAALISDE